MSQENVETVRRGYEAFNRGDIDGVVGLLAPDFEYVASGLVPGVGGVYRGAAGLRGFAETFWAEFDDPHIEIHELIDAGDQVVASTTMRGHGKQSGAETSWSVCQVWAVRDGSAVRGQGFPSRNDALEAVGLSEWEDAEQRGLAEAGVEALNSGDLEAFLALTAEDVEFTSMVAEAEGTTFRGHDGVRAWWETVRGAFEDVRWDLLDIRGSGDRGVLHFRMTGTLGGVPVEQTMWQVSALRDGKVIWWAFFRSEREALEAAGLSE
jgi:hypothetical protein